MKMIKKDHWMDLIMDSVGDDPDRAEEFYTQYKLWERNTIITVGIAFGIMSLIALGIIFGLYWCGFETENPPGKTELMAMFFLWMGAIMGTLCTLVNGALEVRLRKRAENTKYYAGRIEREGNDQCK